MLEAGIVIVVIGIILATINMVVSFATDSMETGMIVRHGLTMIVSAVGLALIAFGILERV